ncbi:FtsX-like permease family protein [Rhodospirillum rubrum]|uniref:ABC3 transporter permease C-terminal domain-containing protein n=1 Tax=Rhodospirillum rubrum (strain ATCC 11170 / ATH 1.1.1 / DSM 467 / LMG 4362 / NCIMB 8255 / S1) TaxID=269796 RepID=Q2RUV2_RHORT|nr:FtsX-like permease family protein [Rhodospirillum rubrum]ABC22093.1 Protein of unknown function DUF214 [Rhodospirillum rubrum ATCC 11170]AEO47807.1 hypothetical protein F11_06685 [Rhodospirillum rubrum F11]MBK5953683.1 ABC transporter permease [Rhodospirillum rubrum]QXG81746.1 FtsX-like permease family protein [Rhodospirillum rubrum]HAQ00347.1 ABC transporter permease [Rhodospirillum rubrum]
MLRFVFADLATRRWGAAALVVIIALATGLGVMVTLQERALRLGSARAAAAFDLVIGAPGSETQLVLSSVFLQAAPLTLMPGNVLAKLAADPRVAYAAPVGFGDFVGDHPIVGTTLDLVSGLGGVTEGRGFEKLSEAVIGAKVEISLGQQIQPMHGHAEEGGEAHAGVSYRVVGRLAASGTPWDRAVLVPIEAVWRVHGHWAPDHDHEHEEEHGHGADEHDHDHAGESDLDDPLRPEAIFDALAPGVPAILVKPRGIAEAYKLRQEYRAAPTMAVFPAEVLTRLYGTMGDARRILAMVAAGAQALVGAAILLVITVEVLQRRRQIGALRAFGAPRRAIFALVWVEAFALLLAGLLGGFALGYGGSLALARGLERTGGIDLPVVFEAGDAVYGLILLGVGALFALLPAALAYRQSPLAALRG